MLQSNTWIFGGEWNQVVCCDGGFGVVYFNCSGGSVNTLKPPVAGTAQQPRKSIIPICAASIIVGNVMDLVGKYKTPIPKGAVW